MEWISPVLGGLGFLLGVVGFIRTLVSASATKQAELIKQQGAFDTRLQFVEKMMDMILKQTTITFAGMMHKPHPQYAKRDSLIEKFVEERITPEELEEFKVILERDSLNPDCPMQDRTLASSILTLLDMRYSLRRHSSKFEDVNLSE